MRFAECLFQFTLIIPYYDLRLAATQSKLLTKILTVILVFNTYFRNGCLLYVIELTNVSFIHHYYYSLVIYS